VVPIHADNQIATCLGKPKLQLRPGGRRRRSCEKDTGNVTDLSRCREQSVDGIVDRVVLSLTG